MRTCPTAVCLTVLAATLGAQDRLAKLSLMPARIRLDHARDRQRVIVVAAFANGVTRDVTEVCELGLEAPLAKLTATGLVPLRDGETRLTARWAGATARARVTVRGAARRPAVSFTNEVIPRLTRAGCNRGSCHGAAVGKNGFRLSLFGFDKAHDWRALTRELHGRRVQPADPDASLMLQKPTMRVAHKGGKRIEPRGQAYRLLREWIASGAKSDVGSAPALDHLEILPGASVLEGEGKRQRLVVRAVYADGSDRDVTDLALLSTSNERSLELDGTSVVSGKPGEAFVLARYGTRAVVSQAIVLASGAKIAWPEGLRANNYIDTLIDAKLRKLRIAPARLCTDAAFVRRAFLDILSVLPTADEAQRFLADPRPDKRARLVNDLLERPEFPDVQAMQWAESLRIESRRLERKGMYVYTGWLRRCFREGVPFDRVVRDLLTSQGGNFTSPPANFFLTDRDPKLIAENVAQNFMGVRVQCAQCHNHPFERWTMDDYYGFAAFFAQVGQKRGENPLERVIFNRRTGEVTNARTGRTAVPKFLGGAQPTIKRGTDRRRVLADWLTSKDNPWFAKNTANRVFARFFGRGLVDPPDDVRVSNPPSHPGLHRELGKRLESYGYDLRKLIRDICASRAYQASSRSEAPAASFAGRIVRRLTAEQLLDAISQVCGVPTKYRGLPLGARATEVAGGRSGNRFLELFGRPARTSACTCERRPEPTLAQVLHLINGPTIEQKIRSRAGRLVKNLRGKASDADLLGELWLAAYSREPRAEEAARVLAHIRTAKQRRSAWEDVFWAVLNSKEFLFQH